MKQLDKLSKVLQVDLSNRSVEIADRRELFSDKIGGTGVGVELLTEAAPEGCDPYGPENPIIFTIGPLNGLFPLASKTTAFFKSPHTGNLGESHCGGRSPTALRMAGFGGVVIKGSSDMPVYLSIVDGQVEFNDARALWGLDSLTTGRIIRENEPYPGQRSILRIGPAGEEMSSFGCVTTDTYRHFGRLGLGAVFGSKNLKAISIAGRSSIQVDKSKEYNKLYSDMYDQIVSSSLMEKYHDLGTPENVLPLNELQAFPTKNLTQAQFSGAENISGEKMAEDFLGRRVACTHCPVGCVHIAALREPYKDEDYFYKTTYVSYDYEPIYSLGSMLGGDEPRGLLKLMDEVETQGLDAISTGVVLAWATEALRQGVVSEEQTLLEYDWGDYSKYIQGVKYLVEQPNEFYETLSQGAYRASKKYGGEEFALTYGGNEMPGYHTGPGAHLGFLFGSRHSHLDSAGYSLDQDNLENKIPPQDLVDELIATESWRQILSSLVICFFARKIYGEEAVSQALDIAGLEFSEDELKDLGREIYERKYQFKLREGFDIDDYPLPGRIFETPSPNNQLNREYVEQAIEYFKDNIMADLK